MTKGCALKVLWSVGGDQMDKSGVAGVALHIVLDSANSLPYPRNRSPPYLYPVSCQLSDKELSVLTSMKD